ncbi:PDC sensor domain-containing protein [Pannonibacter tanglangensis]|uniref:Cache domain-containing protein n=1 Tax=Pannonibacter tanglangensis TaxID=2750084 RepID=A0ABW9ZRX3_9HYPH|nr:PDC sensor domain-containing protein [Pannonibacter sp. XCT-34]NBN65792.1 hypothetical protein [Pannonibacter sp. XCT-34]
MRYLPLAVAFLCLAYPRISDANEFQVELETLASSRVAALAAAPEVIAAVLDHNRKSASLDADAIEGLDQVWRAEVDSIVQPTIDAMMSNSLSQFLARQQEASGGLFTEIFVMDAKGLNVGQSELTSDIWQGDEAKWQDTFLKGRDSRHISDIEQDDSTQTIQSQISLPVVDPSTGTPIGAITVGINIERL